MMRENDLMPSPECPVAATTVATPDGPFTIFAGQSVLASGWTDDVGRLVAGIHPRLRPQQVSLAASDDLARHPGLALAVQALAAYYDGDFHAIEAVPVYQISGPFREAAWRALRQVPPGSPISYAELAARAGSPRAGRAAGSACARNGAALFVPCHRVVHSDGSHGQFGYQPWLKDHLLERESAALVNP